MGDLLSDNLCGIHNVLNDLFPFLQLSIMCVADYAEAYLGGKDIEVAAIRNYDKNLFPTIESLKGLGFDELISKYYKKYPKLFEVQESPAPQPQKPDTPVP